MEKIPVDCGASGTLHDPICTPTHMTVLMSLGDISKVFGLEEHVSHLFGPMRFKATGTAPILARGGSKR